MAMTCVTGGRECDGCMECQERQAFESIGLCAWCGEAVYDDEDVYVFPGEVVVHDDCMLQYVDAHYRHPVR